jgi:hypothetical protein
MVVLPHRNFNISIIHNKIADRRPSWIQDQNRSSLLENVQTEVDGLDGIFPLTASAGCIMGEAIPAGRPLKAI